MLLKLFILTGLFSGLMTFTPQVSHADDYCSAAAMKYHRECLDWGVSAMACAAEAQDVYNDCLQYEAEDSAR